MGSKKSFFSNFIHSKEALSVIALGLLLLFNLFFTRGFFSININDGHLYGAIIDIFKNGAPLMLVSIGMTLVMATGGTDISVGSVAALSAVATTMLYEGTKTKGGVIKLPMAAAILVGLLIGVVCGLINGILVAKLKVQPFITTLMMQSAARGIAYIISNGRVISVHGSEYKFFGSGYVVGIPVSIVIVLAIIAVLALFIRRTSYGLFLESIGTNRTSSYFSGISVDVIILSVFVISGLMAGIGGFLTSSNISAADTNTTGLYMELDAIMACVLGGNSMKGGRFSLLGSFLGAIIVRTLTITIYMKGVPSETIVLYKALVLALVGIIQTVDFASLWKRLRHSKPEEV